MQNLNETERIEILRSKGISAHRGMPLSKIEKLEKGKITNREFNPIDKYKKLMQDFLHRNWDKVKRQLDPHCDGQCSKCCDMLALTCWQKNGRVVMGRKSKAEIRREELEAVAERSMFTLAQCAKKAGVSEKMATKLKDADDSEKLIDLIIEAEFGDGGKKEDDDETPAPRRRGRPPKKQDDDDDETEKGGGDDDDEEEKPAKRRGRPPKKQDDDDDETPAPKRRGRPPKKQDDDDDEPPRRAKVDDDDDEPPRRRRAAKEDDGDDKLSAVVNSVAVIRKELAKLSGKIDALIQFQDTGIGKIAAEVGVSKWSRLHKSVFDSDAQEDE